MYFSDKVLNVPDKRLGENQLFYKISFQLHYFWKKQNQYFCIKTKHYERNYEKKISILQHFILQLEIMLEPSSNPNPWDDKKLEDFLFYLCPECHFQGCRIFQPWTFKPWTFQPWTFQSLTLQNKLFNSGHFNSGLFKHELCKY